MEVNNLQVKLVSRYCGAVLLWDIFSKIKPARWVCVQGCDYLWHQALIWNLNMIIVTITAVHSVKWPLCSACHTGESGSKYVQYDGNNPSIDCGCGQMCQIFLLTMLQLVCWIKAWFFLCVWVCVRCFAPLWLSQEISHCSVRGGSHNFWTVLCGKTDNRHGISTG